MRYFTLGSLLAMVALSFGLAQPAQAYLFGASDFTTQNVLTLKGTEPGTEPGTVQEFTTSLQMRNGGWYNGATHFTFNENYIVAKPLETLPDSNGAAYRNFFVVDIPIVLAPSKEVTEASLTLYSFGVTSNETYMLFDVTTDIHDLIDEDPSISEDVRRSAFDDLGEGNVYGSSGYVKDESTPFDIPPQFHIIPLNQAFIADFNLAIDSRSNNGRFAFAGAVDTYVTVPPNVPEPSTLLLLGLALVGLAAWQRKHAA